MSDAYTAHVASIRGQLKERSSRLQGRGLIHPTESRFLPWWDGLTTLALLYTAIITPWETAFITVDPSVNPWVEPWFIINRLVDAVFLIDSASCSSAVFDPMCPSLLRPRSLPRSLLPLAVSSPSSSLPRSSC